MSANNFPIIKTNITPYPTAKTTGNCLHTGKVNSIDYQSVTLKNTKLTGKKPAKPEINNKQNMNHIDQIFNTHSFGVDYNYGRHGSRFPTGE